jgi:hypothetical protein
VWYRGRPISFPYAGNQVGGTLNVERLTLKHPRAIRQGMNGVDFASLDR